MQWKQDFKGWLILNMSINESTAILIMNHVEHYYNPSAPRLQEATGWVAIEDGLPENGQVLGCMKDTLSIYVCYYKNTTGFQVWGLGREQPITDMKVTHWRPLPAPPKPNNE